MFCLRLVYKTIFWHLSFCKYYAQYYFSMETTHDFGNYFEHQKLDKVYGEPTTKTLQKLFKQLKRNARSVNSLLGGGQYGHLFMVVTLKNGHNTPEPLLLSHPKIQDHLSLAGE